ncbi:MAG TPA: T9SS type A sorting domain-containing protein, partial [Lentimicrobium sp.]|nr:T9SS type A sorting domain-containing protein [Lentimicrobium sp.]
RTSGISFDFRQIWVVVTDQSTGCFTREEVNVLFNFINCSYGIRENEKKSSVRIFPNPAGESVNIGLDRDPEGNLDIQILDIQGRIVAEHTARSHAAGQATVDVAHLPEGIYLVKVTSSAGVFVRKLIISRGY